MTKGILIYAYNNRTVDYALLSIISGGLAKKHLSVPVSLVTDTTTVEWMKQSSVFDLANTVFDKIIITEKPETSNQRFLRDGIDGQMVPFTNTNRHSAWALTPYDRTLLIDSDYFILTDNLNSYWEVDQDIMIGESINDIYSQNRLGYLDVNISETGVKLYWATTVMFTKNPASKLFFDTVEYVKQNYLYYSDVFRFDHRQFRNDIAFSVAKHLLDGFEESTLGRLPAILSALDKDILYEVDGSTLKFLVDYKLDNTYCAAAVRDVDIHIMNKQSIVRHKQQLLGMI
jgi:hypothetical protein